MWKRSPILTTTSISTHDLRHQFSATERDAIEHINQSNQYKILRMIGSFACEGQWSDDLDRACYRAARQFHVDLSGDEMDVIEELHSRITKGRDEEQINAVLATWFELQSYRESYISRNLFLKGSICEESYKGHVLSKDNVRSIREEFYWYTLGYQQTQEQKRRKETNSNYHSRMNALLYKKAAWGHAANAVIKYGLPKIQPSTDDTTECINAMGVFAQDLATWLQSFARGLNEYRNTDDYARARESSRRAKAD